jgi:hypothetical protein
LHLHLQGRPTPPLSNIARPDQSIKVCCSSGSYSVLQGRCRKSEVTMSASKWSLKEYYITHKNILLYKYDAPCGWYALIAPLTRAGLTRQGHYILARRAYNSMKECTPNQMDKGYPLKLSSGHNSVSTHHCRSQSDPPSSAFRQWSGPQTERHHLTSRSCRVRYYYAAARVE